MIEARCAFAIAAQWADRVAARRAVRYDISYDPERTAGIWTPPGASATEPPELEELRAGRVLGVDLNADHLACCVLDASGNPVGDPTSIEVVTAGCRRRGAMGGCARRSPRCSTTPTHQSAARS